MLDIPRTADILHLCPSCGQLVHAEPTRGNADGIVCGAPLGHVVIINVERRGRVVPPDAEAWADDDSGPMGF